MELCKTDVNTILRYLADAAKHYRQHATSSRERDRVRLINKMIVKLSKKLKPL